MSERANDVQLELPLKNVQWHPFGPVSAPALEGTGVRLEVVHPERVPSFLRDGPPNEPDRWLRLDFRAADPKRFAAPYFVMYDASGRERFMPTTTTMGVAYAPVPDDGFEPALRYRANARPPSAHR